jgi:hypothetical protein
LKGLASFALIALALVACRAPAPSPTPTPLPAATATPLPQPTLAPGQPTPEPTADPSDVQDAFLSNVDDLVSEASDLAALPCPDLTDVISGNANLIPSIHGFAAALKRVSAAQPGLDTDTVHTALADMDHIIGQMDGALTQCGITQP